MRWIRPLDATLVVGAAALTGVLVAVTDAGWPEWAFGTVMLSSLALVAHLDGEALWRARSERRRVGQLLATDLQEVARAAVVAERDRLAVDITACLQESLQAILQESRRLDRRPHADPSAGLRRIQQQTRVASSELRRQLGLLHLPSAAAEEPRTGTRHPPAFHGMDLALGAAMVVLATAEASIYPRLYPLPDWSIWSVPLTALAAATVVGRSVAPALAAAACAGAFLVGALLHLPVVTGLWVLGTVCVLLWTLTSSWTRLRLHGSAALLLLGCVIAGVATTDRENFPVTLVVMLVALLGATLNAAGHWRSAEASRQSRTRVRDLQRAADAAVQAERAHVARDLHDLVSHTVGLVAMQAAAAEVSWPRAPATVRDAVKTIERTAQRALVELDQLPGGHRFARRTVADIHALVERMRAAGVRVDLNIEVSPDPQTTTVFYRVLQEALTNVVRHAPGASAHVELTGDGTGCTVSVRDDGPGPPAGITRGYGLVGLAERVGLAGGTMTTGPGAGGRGFHLSARLPAPTELVTS
jgi:signal transduction histidine kinase